MAATEPHLDNLGAAILGMYAAIKICRRNGIDPHRMCDSIIAEVFEKKPTAPPPENRHE